MAQVKKSKDHYHMRTKHIFYFMKKCSADGINIGDNKTYQLEFCFPAYLSCHWKVLNMGRACKVKKMFCHLCGCRSDRCAKLQTGSQRCNMCKKAYTGQCHHRKIDDEAEITKHKQQMCQLKLNILTLRILRLTQAIQCFNLCQIPMTVIGRIYLMT